MMSAVAVIRAFLYEHNYITLVEIVRPSTQLSLSCPICHF
jgi:hypothetical protein